MDPPSVLLCKNRNELILTAVTSLQLLDVMKKRSHKPKEPEENLTGKHLELKQDNMNEYSKRFQRGLFLLRHSIWYP